MPGRGQPWKKGGIVDFTIELADLTQSLQDQITAGGGGGGGWTASRLFENEPGAGTQLFDHSFIAKEGSGELPNRGSPMPKAGKVKSIYVNVFSGYSTESFNNEIRVRKNGANLLVHTFDGTVIALTNTTSDGAFAQGDTIAIAWVKGGNTGTADIGITVEYAFD